MSHSGVYKWSTFDRVASTVLTMGGNIFMARMLSVHDFSLLAMVGIFTAVADNLSSCGMSDWLIREPNPTDDDYSTAFVFNSSLGLLFGLSFFFGSGIIADWFQEPALVDIMRAIGVCFFCGTMTFVQETRLRKLLKMRTIAIVKLCSTACAVGLGIALALGGYGYWALVSCRVFLSVFMLFFYILFSRWFPAIRFNVKSFKAMFSYGINLLFSYVCIQLGSNINASVLGKISPIESGLYSQAQKMEEVPFNIATTSVTGAFFPVVANEPDPGRRHMLVREMGVNMLFLNASLLIFLFVVAPAGFNTLFGHKWDDSIPIFRMILAFGMFANIKQFIIAILKLHGKTRYIRNYTIAEVLLQLSLLALVWQHGVMWIAASQVIAAFIILLPLAWVFKQFEPGSVSRIIRQFIPSLYAPLAAFAISLIGSMMWNGIIPVFIDLVLTSLIFIGVFWAVTGWIKLPVYMRLRAFLLKR